jgi:hypothetical protein
MRIGPTLDLFMKKLMVLLVSASSLLTACATHQPSGIPSQGVQTKPAQENYCPPTQAIKGIC